MEKVIGNSRAITEKPELVQHNFAAVNESLDRYIRSGEPCRVNDRLFNAFCEMLDKKRRLIDTISVIVTVFGILMLTSLIIPIVGAVITVIQTAAAPEKFSPLTFIPFIIVSAGISGMGVLLLVLSSMIKKQCESYVRAIETVRLGQAECYRYKCRQILRYSYYDGETTNYRYYADLKNFTVELIDTSEKWGQAEYAYAVIVNVNNKDVFYMFIDTE
ncbi:MAG: hypothetical protein ACI4JF_06825 [Oscillospiraceae bacterium]